MTNAENIQLDQKYLMQNFGKRFPVAFERGEGVYLYDTEGNRYLDFMSGIAVNALGHSHPALREALHAQVDRVLHTSNLYHVENQSLLAKKLVESSCADRVFFCNSGAEANEGAIKLARMVHYKKGITDRYEVITLENSFHGRTLATVAATGQEKYRKPYRPLTPDFRSVPINDFEALEAAVSDRTCAIMMEPVQGESGVHPLTKEYAKKVRRLCDERGIVLIFDEVQTGIGRTGKLFGYQHLDVEPDIFTLAKALGGGVPIGAVCAKDSVSVFEGGDHGSTFGGNPLAAAAGLAVLTTIEKEKLLDNANIVGDRLRQMLGELPGVTEVRGFGLMIGAELTIPAAEVNAKLFEKKILCGAVGNTLRILPPLIADEDHIEEFIKVLGGILG